MGGGSWSCAVLQNVELYMRTQCVAWGFPPVVLVMVDGMNFITVHVGNGVGCWHL